MCEHHHQHGAEHHNNKNFLLRLGIAFLIFLCALSVAQDSLINTALFLCSYLIAGGDVLLKAFKNILKGEVFDENFLMAIATVGAVAVKEYPEAVMVMLLYQIGEMLQHGAVEKSRKSIAKLMDIRPDYANVEINGNLVKKSPHDVNIGDIVVVKTGEKIPLDGVVKEGHANLDTAALTGEAALREVSEGDDVLSGCINTNGLLKIKVQKEFAQSTVSKILELVENASNKKAKAENFITKFAKVYTPAVVVGALLLAVLPPLLINGAEFSVWFERALTFLVISCPCALVISIPLGFYGGIGGASTAGILIKGSNYIETLANPSVIIFDKTGTLTKGRFKVAEILPAQGVTSDELIEYTAYAECYSSHPIALSIKEYYNKPIMNSRVQSVEEIAGKGICAVVDGKTVLCGNTSLLESEDIIYTSAEKSGTIVYTAINGKYAGYIVISDEVKSDGKTAVREIKELGAVPVMLTGDNLSEALRVGDKLGIKENYAGLLPQNKVEKLEEFINHRPKGKSVIFVGDGINDAPVLTRADVGIAMGALGSDAAIEAADVVIMDDKPSKIAAAVKISRKTISIVKQNIFFALGVKALFLILGAFGFITMWGAVFADVGVSVIAILNSLRTLKVSDFSKTRQ